MEFFPCAVNMARASAFEVTLNDSIGSGLRGAQHLRELAAEALGLRRGQRGS